MGSNRSTWKLLTLVAFTGLAAATLSGCHLHGVSAGFSYHDHHPRTYSDVHAHASGCGHYYWHDSWYGYPHPYDCDWGCGGGAVVAVHTHGSYCGHHYWHGGWYGYPHPYDCHSCGGGHHGHGGYYKAPRADYNDQAEAAYARQQAGAKRQVEQGKYLHERQQAAARQQYERQQAAASQQGKQQQAGAKQQRDQAKWLYERMKKGQAPPP